jgi:hypothetical protein
MIWLVDSTICGDFGNAEVGKPKADFKLGGRSGICRSAACGLILRGRKDQSLAILCTGKNVKTSDF